tara:strand:- start:200 stop:751 length:552 start_codon:yes stop_codon:yes gene_type:complete
MNKVKLESYDNSDFDVGVSSFKWICWFFINGLIVKNRLNPLMFTKRYFLKLFGAKLGKRVIIKPGVNIKFPWRLEVGDYVWLGENVGIENQTWVKIGSNSCLSQDCKIIAGNHDFTKQTFDLITKPISLGEGSWVGAGSIVCPGVSFGSHAVLTVGSIATSNLEPYGIYQGNPALKIKERVIL